MLAIVVHDNDMLDIPKETLDKAAEKVAESLVGPLFRYGHELFTVEFMNRFCAGEDKEVESIITEYPLLELAHGLLNEFFEDPDKMTGGTT